MAPHLLHHRFRWVFCQLEVLQRCLPGNVRQTIDQLPESLDATYLHVLSRIPQVNQAHAHRLLKCLMVAIRPLFVEELAEVLAFEVDGGIPKNPWKLDNQTQTVLSTCSILVTTVKERSTGRQVVQFSHLSVKEFLMSNRLGYFSHFHIHPISAHTLLTQACLGVLLHLDNRTDKESEQGFPLVEYAARHWVEHARYGNVVSRVKAGIETLFDSDKPHFAAWLRIYNMDDPYGWSPTGIPNPLYYAVVCGFYELVWHLAIKTPQQINAICGRYTFPLLAALGEEHIEIARLLIQYGAKVDARDSTTGETILLKALSRSRRNLVNIVTFLLQYGADVNARDDTLTTPLHLAEYGGEFKVAEILVKHGADVNSQDNDGKTPLDILLERRSNSEDDDVLNHTRLLLEHGAVRGGGEQTRQR
jgi:hypothetical protein